MRSGQAPHQRPTRRAGPRHLHRAAGVAAFVTPLWAAEPDRASGLLLLLGVGAELVYSFRRKTSAAQRSAWASAGLTLLLALVLLNTSWLAVTALAIFVAAAVRARRAQARRRRDAGRPSRGSPFLHDACAGARQSRGRRSACCCSADMR